MKVPTVVALRMNRIQFRRSWVRFIFTPFVGTIVVSCLATSAAQAAKPVPPGFVGMMLDGPALSASRFDREVKLMARSGVESVRVPVRWYEIQPYGNFDLLVTNPDRDRFESFEGVPTDFSEIDRIVKGTAKYGLRVLPTVFGTPDWAAEKALQRGSVPADPQTYANFMAALVRRYGNGGSFWKLNPKLKPRPILQWQIWNEPSLTQYWAKQPFAASYVALLKAASPAIKSADPKAKVLLAGLPNNSWLDLDKIYKQPGASKLFDLAAVHPFSAKSTGVALIIDLVRSVMDNYGDETKSLIVTEMSWPSSRGKADTTYGFETDEKGEAKRLREGFELLSRQRGALKIKGIYWYNWISPKSGAKDPFDYGGLRKLVAGGKTVSKPAFKVFKQVALKLEGCSRKPFKAKRCKAKLFK